MNMFTVVLIVAVTLAVGVTVYGLVRPRAGHRIDKNSTHDAASNTARLMRQGNIHRDSSSGPGGL